MKMPHLRAIGHLEPLRNLFRPQQSPRYVPNLVDHHAFHHAGEGCLQPAYISPRQGLTIGGYEFFGRFVEASRVEADKPAFLSAMSLSQVAALALEQTFGAADSYEDIFHSAWAMPESANQGVVFWDSSNDRIVAITKEGFSLAIEGTNLVEAAVYLPRIYEQVKQLQIAEGVGFVEARVEGPQEVWSMAASPLQVKFNLPNLAGFDVAGVDGVVEGRIKAALSNRL